MTNAFARDRRTGSNSLYSRLIEAFERDRVAYCFWRSGRRVEAALSGTSDLDIIVRRSDQHVAQACLLDLDFKEFASVGYLDHPSLMNFVGYDDQTGALLHVHLHARLVLGGGAVKGYRLPWEDDLLQHAITDSRTGLRVLDAASEAVLLLVRVALELRRTSPIAMKNWDKLAGKFTADRAELAGRLDRAQVYRRAVDLLGDETVANALADALYDAGPIARPAAWKRGVRRALAPFRTYGPLESAARETMASIQLAFGRLNKRLLWWPRPWARRAPGGGLVVAVLGVDGSGKTTLVRSLRQWLGEQVDVLPVYLGTGDGRPSLLLLPFKLMLPLAAALVRVKPKGSSHGQIGDGEPSARYGLMLAVWAMIVAREKRTKLVAARRAATRGMVVITDRYPQDAIPEFNDGPLLGRVSFLPGWLRAFEANAYALSRRLPPDLVIRLVASPELIASREPSMSPAMIRRRTEQLQRLTFPCARFVEIPAAMPAADVLAVAKREIWRML